MGPDGFWIGVIVIAIIYWVIWLVLIQEEFIGVLVSIGLAWGTCYLLSSIDTFVSSVFAGFSGLFSGFSLDFSFGSITQAVGYVVLWLLGLAVVAVLGFFGFVAVRGFIRGWRRPQPAFMPAQAQIFGNVNQPQIYQLGPNEFFHGTSEESALKIHMSGFWLIGISRPHGVYLTDVFDTACGYAQKNGESGLVVLVRYNPDGGLDKHSPGHYCYPVDVEEPNEEYHIIQALTPIHILDLNGKIIR